MITRFDKVQGVGYTLDGEFNESDHPRDERGQFSDSGAVTTSATTRVGTDRKELLTTMSGEKKEFFVFASAKNANRAKKTGQVARQVVTKHGKNIGWVLVHHRITPDHPLKDLPKYAIMSQHFDPEHTED